MSWPEQLKKLLGIGGVCNAFVPRKLFNQLLFATEKAIGYLRFEGSELV